jgi:hypothetical protein
MGGGALVRQTQARLTGWDHGSLRPGGIPWASWRQDGRRSLVARSTSRTEKNARYLRPAHEQRRRKMSRSDLEPGWVMVACGSLARPPDHTEKDARCLRRISDRARREADANPAGRRIIPWCSLLEQAF